MTDARAAILLLSIAAAVIAAGLAMIWLSGGTRP